MSRLAPKTSIADQPHRITLQIPGAAIPDPTGGGGFTQEWTNLSPSQVSAKVDPVSASDLERLAPGGSQSVATHVVKMPYHPGVTTETRITFRHRGRERVLYVKGVSNPEERDIETVALCEEIVQ